MYRRKVEGEIGGGPCNDDATVSRRSVFTPVFDSARIFSDRWKFSNDAPSIMFSVKRSNFMSFPF
jgi:hypothetical protein